MIDMPKEWLRAAYCDLIVIEKIVGDEFVTQMTAFHSEQVIEKCFKAVIEKMGIELPKIHDIRRLHKLIIDKIPLGQAQLDILLKINELYIESRYPGELGLMPHGKPTLEDAQEFYKFAQEIFERVCKLLEIDSAGLNRENQIQKRSK